VDSERAILLVDHGSRSSKANAQLQQVASLVQRHAPGIAIAWAHMELGSPTIEQAMADLAQAGVRDVVVVPYMLAPGRHATEDVPRLVRAAARAQGGLTVRVSECLGVDDLLAQLVVERAKAAGLGL